MAASGPWIRPLGKKILMAYGIATGVAVAQYGGYYYGLKEIVRANFEKAPLKSFPELSEPVLIIDGETKFAFRHRGGPEAAKAVVRDTFELDKGFSRACGLQWISVIAAGIGLVKRKAFWYRSITVLVVGNSLFTAPALFSGLRLFSLSHEVRHGNQMIWENLNEARYVQRMDEMFSNVYTLPRNIGLAMILASMSYNSFMSGLLVFVALGFKTMQQSGW